MNFEFREGILCGQHRQQPSRFHRGQSAGSKSQGHALWWRVSMFARLVRWQNSQPGTCNLKSFLRDQSSPNSLRNLKSLLPLSRQSTGCAKRSSEETFTGHASLGLLQLLNLILLNRRGRKWMLSDPILLFLEWNTIGFFHKIAKFWALFWANKSSKFWWE